VLEIRLFGELAVARDGEAIPLPASKKTRALLAYLAATGKPQLRERLCALLWDGPDDPRAALRWSLTKLRPIVPIVADRDRVELAPGPTIDLAGLRAVGPGGAAGIARAPTEGLVAAAEHVRGELLEGLDLPDCYRYDEWLRTERETARRLGAAVLAALVERLRGRPEALGHARAWLALDPLDELAHAAVIRILVELDRRTEALAQYASCERLIERELGRGPSRELERLRVAIGTTSAPAPPPAPVQEPAAPITPLVGRAEELASLHALLDGPGPHVLLLEIRGSARPGCSTTWSTRGARRGSTCCADAASKPSRSGRTVRGSTRSRRPACSSIRSRAPRASSARSCSRRSSNGWQRAPAPAGSSS
jgi:DNA-binding SARP family transcriptional activator